MRSTRCSAASGQPRRPASPDQDQLRRDRRARTRTRSWTSRRWPRKPATWSDSSSTCRSTPSTRGSGRRSCRRARSLTRSTRVFPLASEGPDHEPATTYRFADGAPGGIGVIASVTEPFCDDLQPASDHRRGPGPGLPVRSRGARPSRPDAKRAPATASSRRSSAPTSGANGRGTGSTIRTSSSRSEACRRSAAEPDPAGPEPASRARPEIFFRTKRRPSRSTSPRRWKSDRIRVTFSRLPPHRLARSAWVTMAGTTAPSSGSSSRLGRDQLEEPLGHPTLEIQEQQVVHERLVRAHLPRERPEEGLRGGRLLAPGSPGRPGPGATQTWTPPAPGAAAVRHPAQHAELPEELGLSSVVWSCRCPLAESELISTRPRSRRRPRGQCRPGGTGRCSRR